MEALINNLKIEGVNYTLAHSTSIGKALFCAVIISIACVLAIIVVVKVTKILDKKEMPGIVGALILAACFVMVMLPVTYIAINAYSNSNNTKPQGNATVEAELVASPSGDGTIRVEYDVDSDGRADYTELYRYYNLTPSKKYTLISTITAKEDAVHTESELIDEELDAEYNPIAKDSWRYSP